MDAIKGLLSTVGGNIWQQYKYFLQALRDVRSGQANPETTVDEKTLLRYKLDPDERGLLKSARPADSIRQVTAQEQSNVNRLTNEAHARGEDVVAVNVSYRADIVDGQLAIRAGHTEVVSKPRAENAPQPADCAGQSVAGQAVGERYGIGLANLLATTSPQTLAEGDDAQWRRLVAGLMPGSADPRANRVVVSPPAADWIVE
ncbi:hypothetical protein JW859_09840 [bacterium]|nr:hypothetical protein [bacterium]